MSDLRETADFIEQYGLKDDAAKIRKAADRIEELEKQATLDIVSLAVAKLTKKRLKLAEDAMREACIAIAGGEKMRAHALLQEALQQLQEE